ncbi:MAG: dienelactone hydrolase family protein [Pseudomonadales bacterium]|nr:dienelactone hydrolase family protein [Pseudomonadales bacterium]
MSEMLEYIELEPAEAATSTIIWLHGLGADGHDFEPIVPELKLPASMRTRFIFPHAPMRSISMDDTDQEIRAWFDFIPHSETAGSSDIEVSASQIGVFIEREMERGIASDKILLAGFSQGGVVALQTAIRYPERLAGVLALSTYLHDFSRAEAEMTDANLAIPIMLAHGTQDEMIPIMRAATSRENLIRLGYDVRWFDYHMGHNVCLEEIQEISGFFQELL